MTPSIIACIIGASIQYQIPADILLAIGEKEGGKPGLVSINKNGTADVGLMQFNTAYIQSLANYGITKNDVMGNDCYSANLAAWRIRRHIRNDSGDIWTKVAYYHSRTPEINRQYRLDIMKRSIAWRRWLVLNYVTHHL